MVSWIYCTTVPPSDNNRASRRIHCQGTHCHPTKSGTNPGLQCFSGCFLSFSGVCFLFVFSCIIDKIFASIFSYFLLIYNRTRGIQQLQSFCGRGNALKATPPPSAWIHISCLQMQQVSQYVENSKDFLGFFRCSFFKWYKGDLKRIAHSPLGQSISLYICQ